MPYAGTAEVYFIATMMFLILVISFAAVYIFFKTYKKEMREKAEREARKKRKQQDYAEK